MKTWRACDIMCIAAGVVTIVTAFLPWGQPTSENTYTALQLRLYQPFLVTILMGAGLIATGFYRSMWGALAGLLGGFGATILVLTVHADLYAALNAVGASTPDLGHIEGFGISALFAAGFLSGVAGVATAIQREDPVKTKAESLPELGASLTPER